MTVPELGGVQTAETRRERDTVTQPDGFWRWLSLQLTGEQGVRVVAEVVWTLMKSVRLLMRLQLEVLKCC